MPNLRKNSKRLGGIFDLAGKLSEISRLNDSMAQAGFWDRKEESQGTVSRLKDLKKIVDPMLEAEKECKDLLELSELVQEDSAAEVEDLRKHVLVFQKKLEHLELSRILNEPLDQNSAIVSITPGAGGTESCDWAEMLFRMYTRWCEQSGYQIQMVDFMAGEEAGIKSVSFFARGVLAYGYLKAERGVHRLVRISPFDANKRRHTSFASVDVIAEVEDAPEIEIKEADLRIDTYRAGGAGGQHVNKTSSAVRLAHIPSGIVVQCQNERSQFQNKQVAMQVLKARLFERRLREQDEKLKKQYGEKKEIAWGSQIRSYVFHPYSMVKDHRTEHETSNVQAVMNGDLDAFIEVYLKQMVANKKTL